MNKAKLLAGTLLLIWLGFSGCVHEPWVQKETEVDQISLAEKSMIQTFTLQPGTEKSFLKPHGKIIFVEWLVAVRFGI